MPRCSRTCAPWRSARPAESGGTRVEVSRRPARSAPAPGALPEHRALPAARRPPLGQGADRPALQGRDRRPGTSTCRSPSRCSAARWWCPAAPSAGSRSVRGRPGRGRGRPGRGVHTPALVDPKPAVGRTLAQNLKPGQTLRQTHLEEPPVVRRRRDRAGGRQRPRLRARERGPGAQQRHRGPAGAGAHRKRARPDRACPPASAGSRWGCEADPASPAGRRRRQKLLKSRPATPILRPC